MINFITMTNSGYYTFADSQIENFKKPFLQEHNLYIHCVDVESYRYHKQKDLPNNIKLIHTDVEIGGQHSYLQGRFKEMMRLKFPIILNAIDSLETAVWFIDNDVMFFKDPEAYIDTSKDILFQADMGDYPSRLGWVCTGCFWINNTNSSQQLLKELIHQQDLFDRGEQEILNDYCKSWPADANVPEEVKGDINAYKGANLDILPYYLFQNGYLAFKHSEYNKHECVMIHFNHETDYHAKINNLDKARIYYEQN